MRDEGRLTLVASYPSLEDAEEAGEKLIAAGIDAQVKYTRLLVEPEDLERAQQILDLTTDDLPETPFVFHPCPACGAGDPIWLGKRKFFLLIAIIVVLFLIRSWTFWPYAAGAGVIVFIIGVIRTPEWECRRCHRRWITTGDRADST